MGITILSRIHVTTKSPFPWEGIGEPMGFPPPLVPHLNYETRLPLPTVWDRVVEYPSLSNAVWSAPLPRSCALSCSLKGTFLPKPKSPTADFPSPVGRLFRFVRIVSHPALVGCLPPLPQLPEGSLLAPLRGRWSTDEQSRCQTSEPPDLPIKLATINVDPVAPRGGLGGVSTHDLG
ncbi:hypothetical protein GEV33_006174 [Tenebrio molitor]|uniref:Uncharacterized protein n=1 Tax=Tenebrio molitor TaxID=7067 RepID=A0A8J6HLJ8_TENMO|nr:hypothetical protein GEV33_006174 [Tenebrio molitor]